MHPAETMTTHASFEEITPPEPLADDAGPLADQALAGLRQWLCSAEIRYDAATLSEHCRLWVCDIPTRRWTRVLDQTRSFDTASPDGRRTATADVRCRTRIFADPDTGREALEIRFDSPLGARVLRLLDGAAPEPVEQPLPACGGGFDGAPMAPFDGALVCGGRDQDGQDGLVACPAGGEERHWLALPGGPSTSERFLSGLLAHQGVLYLTLTNQVRGFEVWTMAGALARPEWTLVLARGGHRYAQNQEVLAAFAHRGDLILVAGASPGRRSPDSKFFDYQGFEVLRLAADGSCELLVGVPRFSPLGLLVPLSGRGPNLEHDPRLEFVCGGEHAGCIVIGVADDDGFRLWISADGEDWRPFTTEAFRAIYRVLTCRMVSCGERLTLLMETREVDGQTRTRVLTATLDASATDRR